MAALGFWSPAMTTVQLSWFLGLTAIFMGTVMGVVQVTVQSAAGPAMLGTAAASVQFSRSLGAALGTAAVGMVLFLAIAVLNPDAADVFQAALQGGADALADLPLPGRSEEHTSELQSLMRISYAVICLKTNKTATDRV